VDFVPDFLLDRPFSIRYNKAFAGAVKLADTLNPVGALTKQHVWQEGFYGEITGINGRT
jgi:hypothetical protein